MILVHAAGFAGEEDGDVEAGLVFDRKKSFQLDTERADELKPHGRAVVEVESLGKADAIVGNEQAEHVIGVIF